MQGLLPPYENSIAVIIIIIISELGVLNVVGADRRFNILNRDRLQHRYMHFKVKKLLILLIILVFLHDLCKQGTVRIGFVCVCELVVRTSGFRGLNEAPTSAMLGNNKTNILRTT